MVIKALQTKVEMIFVNVIFFNFNYSGLVTPSPSSGSTDFQVISDLAGADGADGASRLVGRVRGSLYVGLVQSPLSTQ